MNHLVFCLVIGLLAMPGAGPANETDVYRQIVVDMLHQTAGGQANIIIIDPRVGMAVADPVALWRGLKTGCLTDYDFLTHHLRAGDGGDLPFSLSGLRTGFGVTVDDPDAYWRNIWSPDTADASARRVTELPAAGWLVRFSKPQPTADGERLIVASCQTFAIVKDGAEILGYSGYGTSGCLYFIYTVSGSTMAGESVVRLCRTIDVKGV